jgi:hypothetical protein
LFPSGAISDEPFAWEVLYIVVMAVIGRRPPSRPSSRPPSEEIAASKCPVAVVATCSHSKAIAAPSSSIQMIVRNTTPGCLLASLCRLVKMSEPPSDVFGKNAGAPFNRGYVLTNQNEKNNSDESNCKSLQLSSSCFLAQATLLFTS